MAIIECPKCTNKISDRYTECPHCNGSAVKKDKKKTIVENHKGNEDEAANFSQAHAVKVASNCNKCGKEIGFFSTLEVGGEKLCTMCANMYTPDIDAVKRALSALLTQDPDTKKLFEEGSRTYFKLLGGDINNFLNLNSNLIQSSILLKILEKLESIESKLEDK